MSEKLCMFCVHCSFADRGHGDYADPASLDCEKGHFEHYRNFVYDVEDFRRLIVKAKTCLDYEQVKP